MSVLDANIKMSKSGFKFNLECEINEQITGVFGPSGAGKTTLLRLIAGLEIPEAGYIRIQDRPVFDHNKKINLPPEKRKVGYVFQEGRLFPHLNVEKNLRFGQKHHREDRLFKEITEMLKIDNLLKKQPSQISGGQAQRVAVGRALISSPELFILDEPFSALDKDLRRHIISLIKPLISKLGIPILVVSHDLADLLTMTDHLLIIRNGGLSGQGNYYDLINNPESFRELAKSGLINSVKVIPEFIDDIRGVIILSSGNYKIYAEARIDQQRFFDRSQLQIELRPEDITLASHRIEDISMQNQLEGKIEKLIINENKVLCVVDHGFKLIAEVTLATKQKMKLTEGNTIWSLFKAAAVKISESITLKSSAGI